MQIERQGTQIATSHIQTDISLTTTPSISTLPVPTDTELNPKWVTKDNWTAANQIRAMLIDSAGDLWTGGPGGLTHWDLSTEDYSNYVISTEPEKTNVVALIQTPDDSIWVGTYGNGIAKFDGRNWRTFTVRDSLPGNYIVSLIYVEESNVWFDSKKTEYDSDTDQEYYFGQLATNTWIPGVGGGFTWLQPLPDGSILGAKHDTGVATRDSVIGIYNGEKWQDLGFRNQSITAVSVDHDGTIWLAASDGIFYYAGGAWHNIIPPWKSENSASVSSIAISENGSLWFGFSFGAGVFGDCGMRTDYAEELGVYRYDGKTWTRFTTADGLVNNKICVIEIAADGLVYFGSFDKGVSSFNGTNWKTYQTP